MDLLIISFLAGALTVLAPCILPLLPVVVGGSLGQQKRPWQPYIITGSLAVSTFAFTLLLKASTTLLGVPIIVWQVISGGIIILLGLTLLFPKFWEARTVRFNIASSKLLGKAGTQKGIGRDIATGAALGPVFSSCSPTYAFILAAILPKSLAEGILNLAAYIIGLCGVLLLIALGGQKVVGKLGGAASSTGWLKRGVAIIFILVGSAVLLGLDKDIQAFVIDHGWYAPIEQLDQALQEKQ